MACTGRLWSKSRWRKWRSRCAPSRILRLWDELPRLYRDAVVAVEDHRFYSHGGVDFIALCRALWNDVCAGAFVEGGSTITQQLAKNLYFTQEKVLTRKAAEAFMAWAIEKQYTKDEILELYVNSIYFGSGYYNVRQASEGYFGKAPAADDALRMHSAGGRAQRTLRLRPGAEPRAGTAAPEKGGGADGGAGLSERRPGPGGADAGLSTGKPAGAAEPAKRRASRRRAFLLRGARRFSRRAKHSFRFSRIGISRGSECHGERHHRPCQPVRLLGRAAADCRGEHFSADPQRGDPHLRRLFNDLYGDDAPRRHSVFHAGQRGGGHRAVRRGAASGPAAAWRRCFRAGLGAC